MMKRRDFFRKSTALVGGAVVGTSLPEKAEAKPEEPVPDFSSLVPDFGVPRPQPLTFEEKLMGMRFQPDRPRYFYDHPNWKEVRKSVLHQIYINAEHRRVHILDEDGLMAATVYSAVQEWANELVNMDEGQPIWAVTPSIFQWRDGWRIQEGHENRFRYGSFFTDDEEWVQLSLVGPIDPNVTVLYRVGSGVTHRMPYTGLQDILVQVPKDKKSVIRVWLDLPEEIRHVQLGHFYKVSEESRGAWVVPLYWDASGAANHLHLQYTSTDVVWEQVRQENEKRWREFWA